jgi:serine/threonine protein phosphatase PrpC
MDPNELQKKIVSSTNIKSAIKIIDKDSQKDIDPNHNLSSKPNVDISEPKQIALSLKILNKEYDFYERALCSRKPIGTLKAYSYNTYHGLCKKINEDKIIVVNQIKKPNSSKLKTWPKISYFGIFDGHGGEGCSEYLKENFLQCLVKNPNFPIDIKKCLIETFSEIEEKFFKEKCSSTEKYDGSGSCALTVLIFDNKLYIANLGDSRAILSLNGGNKVKQLTIDHKPDNPKEFERAMKNKSKIYVDDSDEPVRDVSKLVFIKDKSEFEKHKKRKEIIIFREYPSYLAVMRTIGDVKVKKKEFGGKPGTIINTPEIFLYDLTSADDFLVLGCDGIYDDLSNQEVVNAAWYIYKNKSKEKNYDINELTQDACDMIMKYAMEKKTSDNLSCIIIGLEGLEKFLKNKMTKDKVNNNFKKDYKRGKTIK